MAYIHGRETSVGIGEESTWGTPVARTHWYRAVSVTAERRLVKEVVPTLANSAGSWMPRRTYLSREEVRVRVRLIGQYDGMGPLWKHALWATPATSGSGPYTHTYEVGTTAPGLTVEVIRGTAANSEVYSGCVVAKLTVSCEAGGLLMVEVELIGRTAATRAARGTPTYHAAEELIHHHQAGTLGWSSRTLTLRSWRLTLDTRLAERQQLGSLTTGMPASTGVWSATMDAELDSDSTYGDGLYQDLHDDDQADATMAFTGPSPNAIQFILHNAKLLVSSDTDISSVGVIPHRIQLVGLSDGTDEGCAVVATNSSSSAVAV